MGKRDGVGGHARMVCVDFRREFEAAPHQLLVGKVLKDGQKGSWVKNWLNWAQREASVV